MSTLMMTGKTYATRDEWLSERRKFIGASDVAAVLGLNPWKSPLDVWGEKTGLIPPPEETPERLQIGLDSEPVVEACYRRRHPGQTVLTPEPWTVWTHPTYPFLRATLDRVIDRPGEWGHVLELKTASARSIDYWATDPPLQYRVQLMAQLATVASPEGVLAALVGGSEYREFGFTYDPEFMDLALPKLLQFWECVEQRVQPDWFEPTPALARSLERLHPDDNGESVMLPPEAAGWDERLLELAVEKGAIEDEIETLKAKLKASIGGASYGVIPGSGVSYSWMTQERPPVMTKGSKFRMLLRRKAAIERKGKRR